tara:strand:+ start:5503 stop:5892 length:390 start_codon:yes stop_codon:yes gene_type:complete
MSDKFTVEIISPDKSILVTEASEVVIPSYEGEMGILKDHISIITFLRPGLIKIINETEKIFFVDDGIVEFSNNNLLILSSTAKEKSNIDQNTLDALINEAEEKFSKNTLTDKERYLLSYRITTLKNINQ